uniref:Peptidase A2 domain-containing protein n=1 Tax=Trichogramma kaykai TaxID=54128 RepID=A0ABD2WDK0_9HYME
MLIDLGSKHNIITDKTWEYLKSQKVQAFNQIKNQNQVLKLHGNKSLTIIGSFETKISLNGKNPSTKIYVIKDGSRNLLGKITAIAAGVLKLGIDINNISTAFPKFKNISVEIPIDSKVKPVMQPHRRIAILLEEKVNSKLEELLQNDIIEEVKGPSKWVSPMVPILKENGETVQQKERRRIYQRRSRARKRELEKKIEEEIEKEFVEKLEETPKEEESDLVDPRSSPPTTTTSRTQKETNNNYSHCSPVPHHTFLIIYCLTVIIYTYGHLLRIQSRLQICKPNCPTRSGSKSRFRAYHRASSMRKQKNNFSFQVVNFKNIR